MKILSTLTSFSTLLISIPLLDLPGQTSGALSYLDLFEKKLEHDQNSRFLSHQQDIYNPTSVKFYRMTYLSRHKSDEHYDKKSKLSSSVGLEVDESYDFFVMNFPECCGTKKKFVNA